MDVYVEPINRYTCMRNKQGDDDSCYYNDYLSFHPSCGGTSSPGRVQDSIRDAAEAQGTTYWKSTLITGRWSKQRPHLQ